MGMPRIRKPAMPKTQSPMGMPPLGGAGDMSSVPGLPSVPDPSQIAMGEPMDSAWSTIIKNVELTQNEFGEPDYETQSYSNIPKTKPRSTHRRQSEAQRRNEVNDTERDNFKTALYAHKDDEKEEDNQEAFRQGLVGDEVDENYYEEDQDATASQGGNADYSSTDVFNMFNQHDLQKMNYSDLTEIRMLLRRIARAKEVEAKESKKKGGIQKPSLSELPNHPAGVSSENDELDPDGPTENTEMNANRLGLDPAGYLTSRGGHMG